MAVILNSPTVTEDATTLMDEGFARLRSGQPPGPATKRAPEPAQTDAEPAPGDVVLTKAAALAARPRESRMPSIPGTLIVLGVAAHVLTRRRRGAFRSRGAGS